MRAQVLEPPRPIHDLPLREVERPIPQAGPGQLLLNVRACGVCRTDLHTVEGDLPLPRLPLTPGHQVVGRVVDLGQGASGFEIGQRVGVVWLYRACGECDFCRSGRENLCPQAQFTGLHVDGALRADVVTFPLAEANAVLLALKESRFNGDAVLLPYR